MFSLLSCVLCGFTLRASLVRQRFSIERRILRRFSSGGSSGSFHIDAAAGLN
jgi:hypothetical protein